MFLLFLGYGTKLKLLGESTERTCPRCHNTSRWQRLERYRYVSLLFVRIARWQREQLDACPVCGHAQARIDARQLRWAQLRRRSPGRHSPLAPADRRGVV